MAPVSNAFIGIPSCVACVWNARRPKACENYPVTFRFYPAMHA